MYRLIDTHAHLEEIENLPEALRRAKKAGSDIRVYCDIGDPTKELSKWSKNIELIDWYTIWTRTPINPNWSEKTLKMLSVAKRFKTGKIIHLKFKA